MSYRLVSVLILALLLIGCAHDLDRGRAALESGDQEAALKLANEALAQDPDSPWANLLKAEALVAAGHPDQALPAARRATHAEDYHVQSHRLLGDILMALDRSYVEAARAYDSARAASPNAVDDPTYIKALKSAIRHRVSPWNKEQILWALLQLRALDPDHELADALHITEIRRHIAEYADAAGDTSRAIAILKTNIEDYPDQSAAYLDLGKYYFTNNEPDRADQAWSTYLDLSGDEQQRIERLAKATTTAMHYGALDWASTRLRHTLEVHRDELPSSAVDLHTILIRVELRRDDQEAATEAAIHYLEGELAGAEDPREIRTTVEDMAELFRQLASTESEVTVLEWAEQRRGLPLLLTFRLSERYLDELRHGYARAVIDRLHQRHDPDADELSKYALSLTIAEWAHAIDQPRWARDYYERARQESRHIDATADAKHAFHPTDYPDSGPDLPLSKLGDYIDLLVELDDPEAISETTRHYHYLVGVTAGDEASPNAEHHAHQLLRTSRWMQAAQQPDEALTMARSAADTFTDLETVQHLASLYVDDDNWSAVEQTWYDAMINHTRYDQWRCEAQRFFVARDSTDRALSLFERLSSEIPTAHLSRAELYADTQDRDAMIEALLEYVSQAPERVSGLLNALALLDGNQLENSQMEQLDAQWGTEPVEWQLTPERARLAIALSRFYYMNHRQSLAQEVITGFVETLGSAESRGADRALDVLVRAIDRPADAQAVTELLEKHLQDHGSSPALHRFLGMARLHQQPDSPGRATRSILLFLEATKGHQQPDGSHASWADLGAQWAAHHLWDVAAVAFERDQDYNDAPIANYETRLRAFLNAGDAASAQSVFQAARESFGTADQSTQNLAELLLEHGQFQYAAPYLEDLFSGTAYPDEARHQALRHLASIHIRREEPRRLLDHIDSLDAGEKYRFQAPIQEQLKRAGLHEERFRFLVDQTHQASHGDRYRIADPHLWALYHGRRGEYDRAEIALEQGRSLNAEAQDWLDTAEFWRTEDDPKRTGRALNRALQIDPDHRHARLHRAAFLTLQGHPDRAWRDYEYCRDYLPECHRNVPNIFVPALIAAGHHDLIDRLARQRGDEPEELRNAVEPRDPELIKRSSPTSSEAEDLAHTLADDDERDLIASDRLDRYLDNADDRQQGRRHLVRALLDVRKPELALAVAADGASAVFRPDTIRLALYAALVADDEQAIERWLKALRTVDPTPGDTLQHLVSEVVDTSSPDLLLPLAITLTDALPEHQQRVFLEVRLLFRSGRTDDATSQLQSYLEARSLHPHSILDATDAFGDQGWTLESLSSLPGSPDSQASGDANDR